MRRHPSAVVLALLALACGGGGAPAPPPGTPAVQLPAPSTARPVAGQPQDTATRDTAASRTGLVREVFAYRSAGRDPLLSLLTSGEVRPLLDDLRLTTIVYDARYPARSVAVLRDVSVNKRYDVRVDDELGRLRVIEIRPREVVFSLDEFGVTRQVTLAMTKHEGVP